MKNNNIIFEPDIDIARQLIAEQFPQYAHLNISSVEKQGYDNRTFRLGAKLLIRLPTAASYALKVAKEQELLPKLAPYLNIGIPQPIAMGAPSAIYPFHFSIYQWLEGTSLNLLILANKAQEQLANALTSFLQELQNITEVTGPEPGQHNWWRGDHIGVYEQQARDQINKLSNIIDTGESLKLLDSACQTKWSNKAVWIHGDLAIGNILIEHNKLAAIIDFGGMGIGDPACDLAIAWTYFQGTAREAFIRKMNLDQDTWLRAKAWVLWKATYELCQIDQAKNSVEYLKQQKIIEDLLIDA